LTALSPIFSVNLSGQADRASDNTICAISMI
jgi:hypothetical protein